MLETESVITNMEELLLCIGNPISIDIETTGLSFWRDNIIGFGFYCPRLGKQGYITTLDDETIAHLLATVQILASDPQTVFIAHNLTFEALFLELNLRKVRCKFYDTMVMMHLEDSRQGKKLEEGVERYLGIKETKHVYREAGKNQPIYKWPLYLVSTYCVNDCIVTYNLFMELWEKLRALKLLNLLQKDMRYLALLTEVSRRGMVLDQEFLENAERIISQNVVLMERDLHEKVGRDFNWRSTKQLSESLYGFMGIEKPVNPFLSEDGVDRNKNKSPLFNRYNSSCTSSFLLMEKAKHPLGALVLDLRESDKLARNYCKQWRELVDSRGIIHGSFNITGTRTGRLSSSRPNLQNLPGDVRTRETQSVYSGGAIRSGEYNLRQAFKARAGHTFLSVDFKQQEMRLFAFLSREPKMMKAVKERRDIHSYIADLVWGTHDKVHREWSKTIGFGLLYGMTTGTLHHRLGQTPEQAGVIVNTYLGEFPGIMPFMAQEIRHCKAEGFVRYWSGRIWREDNSKFFYKSVNAEVQGGGADLLSVAALRAQDWLDTQDAGHIVSFIHDELLMEIKDECLDLAIKTVPGLMEVEDLFGAPFLTEWKTGPSYGMLHEPT